MERGTKMGDLLNDDSNYELIFQIKENDFIIKLTKEEVDQFVIEAEEKGEEPLNYIITELFNVYAFCENPEAMMNGEKPEITDIEYKEYWQEDE